MPDEIRPLKESEFIVWDALVDNSAYGTLFHKSSWLKACGRRFTIYGYFKNKDLLAGVPLVYRTILGFKRASQPALTPYSGIIFRKQDLKYVKRISREKDVLCSFAKRLKNEYHSCTFRFAPGAIDLQPFIWEGYYIVVSYTYMINLNNSLADIWSSMEDTRRNDIRKAEKDGIMIDISDNFEQAFCLVEKTYTRQKRKATFKSSAFNYYDVLKKKNQCKCFFAKDINHEPIAVVFIIWDNKRCYYLLGGYDSDKSHHGASALAMWEAMKFAKIELGVSEFDFEGSMVRPIERFFRKFGGEQIPLYSVSWENSIIKNLRKIYHNYLRYR